MNRDESKGASGTYWRAVARALVACLSSVLIIVIVSACSSDEESRQWYVDELERTNSFEADEARCYVDAVADEFGVHALNPSRALPSAGRVRLVELQNECRNIPTERPLAFSDGEGDAESDSERDAESESLESDPDQDDPPSVNYNRRKNVIKRLKNRLGLSTWDASCLIDTVMAETDRQVVTWAGASAELQNEVLATCLKSDNDG